MRQLYQTGDQDLIGTINLHNLTSGAGYVGIEGQTASNSGSFLGSCLVVGYYDGGAIVVNAIQLAYSSGNIVSGTFSLYGLSS